MQTLFAVVVAVFYGLFMRLIFGLWEGFQVMSVTFLGLLPFIFGFLSIWFSKPEKVESKMYAFFFPWLTTLFLLLATVILAIEGTICWVMIYPFFAALAGCGGLIARYFMMKKLHPAAHLDDDRVLDDLDDFRKNSGLQVSILMLLPFAAGWLESGRVSPRESFSMENSIEIAAAPEEIWKNVTRVSAIQPAEDHATINKFLGMPRPIEAVLDTLAVGGYRKAIFERGMIFHEKVTKYEPLRLMVFSIDANPAEIPAAAMDEHIVVGGQYFDVLEGEYRLETLADGRCRLNLSSHFVVSTPFNFYSGKWAQWIMWDIQQNILQVIKKRSEH